jgi:hypothetical protein
MPARTGRLLPVQAGDSRGVRPPGRRLRAVGRLGENVAAARLEPEPDDFASGRARLGEDAGEPAEPGKVPSATHPAPIVIRPEQHQERARLDIQRDVTQRLVAAPVDL